MKNEEIDFKKLGDVCTEISSRFKLILDAIPEQTVSLKHLAACSIHFAFFVDQVRAHYSGEFSPEMKELEDKFLANCGCNDDKTISH